MGAKLRHRYLASIPALGPAVAIRTRSCGGINRRDRDFARQAGIWKLGDFPGGGFNWRYDSGSAIARVRWRGIVDATPPTFWFRTGPQVADSSLGSSRLVSNLESILRL